MRVVSMAGPARACEEDLAGFPFKPTLKCRAGGNCARRISRRNGLNPAELNRI